MLSSILYLWAGYIFGTISINLEIKQDPSFLSDFASKFSRPVNPKDAHVLLMLAFILAWLPISLKIYLFDALRKKENN